MKKTDIVIETAELAKQMEFEYTPELHDLVEAVKLKLKEGNKEEAKYLLLNLKSTLLRKRPEMLAIRSLDSLIETRKEQLLLESKVIEVNLRDKTIDAPIIIFDLESDKLIDAGQNPFILEVHAQLCSADFKVLARLNQVVNVSLEDLDLSDKARTWHTENGLLDEV